MKTSKRNGNTNKRIPITPFIILLFFVIAGSTDMAIGYFMTYAQQAKETQLQLPEIPLEPPQAKDISTQTSPNTPVIIEFQTKDSNPDSQLTVSIVSPPTKGKLGDIDQTARIVTYTPRPNFTGDDSFTYKVNNGRVDSNTATISVKIYPQCNLSQEQAPERGPSLLESKSMSQNCKN